MIDNDAVLSVEECFESIKDLNNFTILGKEEMTLKSEIIEFKNK